VTDFEMGWLSGPVDTSPIRIVRCDLCGTAVLDQTRHTTWHEQNDLNDGGTGILAWLDSIDVAELERLALSNAPLSVGPVQAVLDALRKMAGATK